MFKVSAYDKQGCVKIACLVTKFRGYGIDVWKIACHPPPSRCMVACDD